MCDSELEPIICKLPTKGRKGDSLYFCVSETALSFGLLYPLICLVPEISFSPQQRFKYLVSGFQTDVST